MGWQALGNFFEYGLGTAIVVLSLVAAYSALRSQIHSPGPKALWVVFTLVLPIAGAVLWFFVGRETPAERRKREAEAS